MKTREKIQVLIEKYNDLLRKDGEIVYVLHPETKTWVTENDLLKEKKEKKI